MARWDPPFKLPDHCNGAKPLADDRHEQYAQAAALGYGGSDAVRAAGYNARQPHQQARLLMLRPDVQARIKHLQAEKGIVLGEDGRPVADHPAVAAIAAPALAQVEVVAPKPTRDWILSKYMLAVRMAEEREDRASMIRGLDSIAKMEGHMVERTEVRQGPLDAFTPDQLAALGDWARQMKERAKAIADEKKAAKKDTAAAEAADGPDAGEPDAAA